MESTLWNVLIKFIHTLKLFNSNPYTFKTLQILPVLSLSDKLYTVCTCRPAQPTGNKINICYEFVRCFICVILTLVSLASVTKIIKNEWGRIV